MELIYVGPYDAVDVPEAGIVAVEREKPVEVEDEKVAKRLLEQDVWEKVKAAMADARAGSMKGDK